MVCSPRHPIVYITTPKIRTPRYIFLYILNVSGLKRFHCIYMQMLKPIRIQVSIFLEREERGDGGSVVAYLFVSRHHLCIHVCTPIYKSQP